MTLGECVREKGRLIMASFTECPCCGALESGTSDLYKTEEWKKLDARASYLANNQTYL